MRALGLGLLVVSVGMVGCGPDIRSECEKQVECGGGNDKDIEACVAVYDVFEDFLDDLGCGDEYDAYFTCIIPLSQCKSNPTGQMCTTVADCDDNQACTNGGCVRSSYTIDADDREMCDAEVAAYSSCVNF
jgi:hypothetical protein